MRFSLISTALALVGAAFAQTTGFDPITSPKTGEVVPAGSTYTIKWDATRSGKITISLIGGADPSKLFPVSTIATGIDSSAGEYAWSVDSSLGQAATYGIQITLESDTTIFQYGFPFVIKSSGTSSASGSSSVSGYATTGSSAAATSYPATSVPSLTTSASSYSTMTPIGNLSTTLTPKTTATTLTTASTSSTRTGTASSTIPSAAGNRVAAGSLALVGGIAAAFFAL